MVGKYNSIYTSGPEHELNNCIGKNQYVLATMYSFIKKGKNVSGIFVSKFPSYLKMP